MSQLWISSNTQSCTSYSSESEHLFVEITFSSSCVLPWEPIPDVENCDIIFWNFCLLVLVPCFFPTGGREAGLDLKETELFGLRWCILYVQKCFFPVGLWTFLTLTFCSDFSWLGVKRSCALIKLPSLSLFPSGEFVKPDRYQILAKESKRKTTVTVYFLYLYKCMLMIIWFIFA